MKGFRFFSSPRITFALTGGGAVYLFALVLVGVMSYLTANNLLFLVFSAMLALLLVSGVIGRLVLAGIELELVLPARVFARTPAEARIRIRNLKRLTPSLALDLSDFLPGNKSAGFFAKTHSLPPIAGGGTLDLPLEVVFPRRGRVDLQTFYLSTRFPFGFIRRTASIEVPCNCIVLPALAAPAKGSTTGPELVNRGAPGESSGSRPLISSDDARWIDWKSTARTGAFYVREYWRTGSREVDIAFDLRISPGEEERFERALERCAAVCRELYREQARVSLKFLPSDDRPPRADGSYDILILLALAQPLVWPMAQTAERISADGQASADRIVIGAETE